MSDEQSVGEEPTWQDYEAAQVPPVEPVTVCEVAIVLFVEGGVTTRDANAAMNAALWELARVARVSEAGWRISDFRPTS